MAVPGHFPKAVDFLQDQDGSAVLDFPSLEYVVDDPENCSKPLDAFDAEHIADTFPESSTSKGPKSRPKVPKGFKSADFLQPSLTRNEYLRLTTLWYHARNALENEEFVASIQSKIELVRDVLEWDFALCGLLGMDTFARFVSVGMPPALVPRRESPCSHTIQAEGKGFVFQSSDLSKDWRFQKLPSVYKDGLRSYAGAPLRCQVQNGDTVAIGSLCVVSDKPGKALSPSQQATLSRFADMVMAEIVAKSRVMRREQQQRMSLLLASVTLLTDIDEMERRTMAILKEIYPHATVTVNEIRNSGFNLPGGRHISLSEIEHGLWEDTTLINDIIKNENHRIPLPSTIFRFATSVLRIRPHQKILLVGSTDLRHIFDDIDAWFVDRCGAILASIVQERLLAEARLAKERFLRGITHQLRTPIHGVLGSVDLLVEDLTAKNLLGTHIPASDIDEALARAIGAHATNGAAAPTSTVNTSEMLRTIQNSGRELMSTVNNILRLNKWDQSVKAEEMHIPHELSTLEDDILAETRRLLPEMQADRLIVYFENRLPFNVSTTMLNIDLVKECLEALVLNAMLFTQNGYVIVTTSCPSDLSSIVFDVRDSGKGIRPENCARVFEDYEKEDPHTRGVGLGLTLASKIAAAMSGSVELVSSVPGKGSHFRLTFNNPRLGGDADSPHPDHSVSNWEAFPYYSLIPQAPPSGPTKSFTDYLERYGATISTVHNNGLTVVAYDTDAGAFARNLDDAMVATGTIVCLVPPHANPGKLCKLFPRINFFEGPFTANRLARIMSTLNNNAQQRRPSLNQQSPITPPRKASEVASPVLEVELENKLVLRHPSERKKGKPNALLVDDNIINLKIIRMWCDKRSHPYRLAMDGLQAVAQYRKSVAEGSPVSLVLLDLQMPNSDGIEACEVIRETERSLGLQAATIFIITGQDDPKDRERALQAGADEFYVKPMGLKMLDQATSMYFDMQV